MTNVLFKRAANLFVFVGINQRADPFVGKNFREQTFINAAIDNMNARNARFARARSVVGFGDHVGRELTFARLQHLVEVSDKKLANELTVADQAIVGGDENELGSFQRATNRDRDRIGIDAISAAFAIETKRRDDRNNSLGEENLQHLHIDAFDLAGVKMIDAVEDAHRMRDDGVRGDGAEIVGGEPFQDFMRKPAGGGERELQRLGIRDAAAVQVRRRDFLFFAKLTNLRAGAMNEHDADVQRAQDRDIEKDVREIFVRHNRPIDAQDERLFAKARNILQDAPQVSRFHRAELVRRFG